MRSRVASDCNTTQNIPRPTTDLRRMLRRLIVPHYDDEYIMEIDFSQMELRQLAMESGDKELLRCFRERIDVHRRTAAAMCGKSPDDVTEEERQQGKPINFGEVRRSKTHSKRGNPTWAIPCCVARRSVSTCSFCS